MSMLTTEDVSRADLEELLDLGDQFLEVLSRPIPKVPALRGRTVALMFFEPSTRTRLSFERAAKALSADTMTFSPGTSSLSKGESLKDTVLTLRAMGPDLMVVRHRSVGVARLVEGWARLPVVNAGDGAHQHPTQALLDALTIRRHFGKIEGLRVAIIGDIRHSRVARSNVYALTTLGATVTLVGPRTLLPVTLDGWPVDVAEGIDDVLDDTDVVYLLRIQAERGGTSVVPSLPEYVSRFGLTKARFQALHPESVVMHPGPMNRGIEISAEVADDERALITQQVTNGVAVRMAVLFRLLGGEEHA
jgi:aspartate carbamoyltransferase catalytic subunit